MFVLPDSGVVQGCCRKMMIPWLLASEPSLINMKAGARQLNIVMSPDISILDTKASDMKENFYHGLLLGLLRGSNPGLAY